MGPMVMPMKMEVNTVEPWPSMAMRWRAWMKMAKGMMAATAPHLALEIKAMSTAQMVKIRPEYWAMMPPKGDRSKATIRARGSTKMVPTREPEAILRMAM